MPPRTWKSRPTGAPEKDGPKEEVEDHGGYNCRGTCGGKDCRELCGAVYNQEAQEDAREWGVEQKDWAKKKK